MSSATVQIEEDNDLILSTSGSLGLASSNTSNTLTVNPGITAGNTFSAYNDGTDIVTSSYLSTNIAFPVQGSNNIVFSTDGLGEVLKFSDSKMFVFGEETKRAEDVVMGMRAFLSSNGYSDVSNKAVQYNFIMWLHEKNMTGHYFSLLRLVENPDSDKADVEMAEEDLNNLKEEYKNK